MTIDEELLMNIDATLKNHKQAIESLIARNHAQQDEAVFQHCVNALLLLLIFLVAIK